MKVKVAKVRKNFVVFYIDDSGCEESRKCRLIGYFYVNAGNPTIGFDFCSDSSFGRPPKSFNPDMLHRLLLTIGLFYSEVFASFLHSISRYDYHPEDGDLPDWVQSRCKLICDAIDGGVDDDDSGEWVCDPQVFKG